MQTKEKKRTGKPRNTRKEKRLESEDIKFHLERLQLENDLAKHIATLDTGSILIVATFLERFSVNPVLKELVWVALAAFIVSLIAILVYEFALVMEASGRVYRKQMDKRFAYLSRMLIEGGAVAMGITFFGIGLIVVAIFALVNL